MKYIWSIVAVAFGFAVVIVYFTITPRTPDKDVAIFINNKRITQKELEINYASINAKIHASDIREYVRYVVIRLWRGWF